MSSVQMREMVEFTGSNDDVIADAELEAIAAGGGCSDWVDRDDGYVFTRGRNELYWVARNWFRAKMKEEGVNRYKGREERFLSEQRRKLDWMSDKRDTAGAKSRIMRGFTLTPHGRKVVDRLIPFIRWGKDQDSTTTRGIWHFWSEKTYSLVLDEFEKTGGFNHEDLQKKQVETRADMF